MLSLCYVFILFLSCFFFFSSRRRHTRCLSDWSSDVCSSDLQNLVPREEMSMQRIRDWMAANPEEAPKLRATNRSYIFFRITGLSNDGEPAGAQGAPLTPGRSIAVDKIHVYGPPFFIDASLPIDGHKAATP